MFIDSHCHLDRLKLDPYNGHLSKAIEAATENLVDLMLCVAIDLEHIEDVLSIAATHDSVYASVGVHPGSTDCEEPTVDGLIALSKRDKVIAIGETGLDYYYGVEHKELQLEWFKRHLEVSKRTRKPVIIHTRDAKEDTLRYIHDYSDPDVAGVLHCFTEDLDMAKRAIDHNFYISFSGIVTFKNAEALRDVADQRREAGKPPRIFLAALGPLAEHSARLTYATNFFAAGGIEATPAAGSAKELAEAFRDSGCQLVCICGADARYEAEAEEAARALRDAGASRLYLAGKPGQMKEAYLDSGIDAFIFVGVDVVASLELAHAELGLGGAIQTW